MRSFLYAFLTATSLPLFVASASAQAMNTPFSPTQAPIIAVPDGEVVAPGAVGARPAGTRLLAARPVLSSQVPVRSRFCPEGRTSTGECVRPVLAQAARLTSCINTQGSLSASAGLPCTSVLQDDDFRYPNAVYVDTKRALDIALNRRASSFDSITYGTRERFGPGTPNPTRYPIYYGR